MGQAGYQAYGLRLPFGNWNTLAIGPASGRISKSAGECSLTSFSSVLPIDSEAGFSVQLEKAIAMCPICDLTLEHDLDCPISDMLSVWYTSLKNYPLLIKLSRLAQDLNREVHLPQPPRSGGYTNVGCGLLTQ